MLGAGSTDSRALGRGFRSLLRGFAISLLVLKSKSSGRLRFRFKTTPSARNSSKFNKYFFRNKSKRFRLKNSWLFHEVGWLVQNGSWQYFPSVLSKRCSESRIWVAQRPSALDCHARCSELVVASNCDCLYISTWQPICVCLWWMQRFVHLNVVAERPEWMLKWCA